MGPFLGLDAIAAARCDGLRPELRTWLLAQRDATSAVVDKLGNIVAPGDADPASSLRGDAAAEPMRYAVSGL